MTNNLVPKAEAIERILSYARRRNISPVFTVFYEDSLVPWYTALPDMVNMNLVTISFICEKEGIL